MKNISQIESDRDPFTPAKKEEMIRSILSRQLTSGEKEINTYADYLNDLHLDRDNPAEIFAACRLIDAIAVVSAENNISLSEKADDNASNNQLLQKFYEEFLMRYKANIEKDVRSRTMLDILHRNKPVKKMAEAELLTSHPLAIVLSRIHFQPLRKNNDLDEKTYPVFIMNIFSNLYKNFLTRHIIVGLAQVMRFKPNVFIFFSDNSTHLNGLEKPEPQSFFNPGNPKVNSYHSCISSVSLYNPVFYKQDKINRLILSEIGCVITDFIFNAPLNPPIRETIQLEINNATENDLNRIYDDIDDLDELEHEEIRQEKRDFVISPLRSFIDSEQTGISQLIISISMTIAGFPLGFIKALFPQTLKYYLQHVVPIIKQRNYDLQSSKDVRFKINHYLLSEKKNLANEIPDNYDMDVREFLQDYIEIKNQEKLYTSLGSFFSTQGSQKIDAANWLLDILNNTNLYTPVDHSKYQQALESGELGHACRKLALADIFPNEEKVSTLKR